MKKWMTLLLTGAMAFSLAACGSGSGTEEPKKEDATTTTNDAQAGASEDKEVTLRIAWWGGQPRHDYTLKVIEEYKKLHPNVKFETEYANYDDYWKRLAPQAAANELPDIVQIDTAYFTQYAGKDQLEDLTPYLNAQIDVSDISENALNAGKLGDKLYGMNLGVNVLQFQYNPELLKSIGYDSIDPNWTWDDYKTMAAKAAEKGLYFDTGMRPEVFFGYYLRTKGQHLYAQDGTPALGYTDDQLFVDFFKMKTDMVLSKAAPSPDVSAQIKGVEDDPVVKKQGIGIWQWSNQFVGLQQVAQFPMVLQTMPGPDAKQGLFLKPSMFFSISKNSEVKEEAAKFINYFVNDIEANKLIKGDRGVPVAAKVKEGIKSVLTPEQVQVFDSVAWAESNTSPGDAPDPAGSAEIITLLANLSESMAYSKTTPEEAAAKFREEATAILQKNSK